jgi:hypothetical protein
MRCKYYFEEKKEFKQLGGDPIIVNEGKCLLKMQNPSMQLQIYSALFDKGYESSFVNNLCPVATINKWQECPFFENN